MVGILLSRETMVAPWEVMQSCEQRREWLRSPFLLLQMKMVESEAGRDDCPNFLWFLLSANLF